MSKVRTSSSVNKNKPQDSDRPSDINNNDIASKKNVNGLGMCQSEAENNDVNLRKRKGVEPQEHDRITGAAPSESSSHSQKQESPPFFESQLSRLQTSTRRRSLRFEKGPGPDESKVTPVPLRRSLRDRGPPPNYFPDDPLEARSPPRRRTSSSQQQSSTSLSQKSSTRHDYHYGAPASSDSPSSEAQTEEEQDTRNTTSASYRPRSSSQRPSSRSTHQTQSQIVSSSQEKLHPHRSEPILRSILKPQSTAGPSQEDQCPSPSASSSTPHSRLKNTYQPSALRSRPSSQSVQFEDLPDSSNSAPTYHYQSSIVQNPLEILNPSSSQEQEKKRILKGKGKEVTVAWYEFQPEDGGSDVNMNDDGNSMDVGSMTRRRMVVPDQDGDNRGEGPSSLRQQSHVRQMALTSSGNNLLQRESVSEKKNRGAFTPPTSAEPSSPLMPDDNNDDAPDPNESPLSSTNNNPYSNTPLFKFITNIDEDLHIIVEPLVNQQGWLTDRPEKLLKLLKSDKVFRETIEELELEIETGTRKVTGSELAIFKAGLLEQQEREMDEMKRKQEVEEQDQKGSRSGTIAKGETERQRLKRKSPISFRMEQTQSSKRMKQSDQS